MGAARQAHRQHGHPADGARTATRRPPSPPSSSAIASGSCCPVPSRARSTPPAWPGYAKTVQTDDDLLEWDYGADEGRTTADIRVGRPGWSIWDDGPDGGESIDDVGARVDRVIARVRAQSGDALLFAHAHVLRILTRALDRPAARHSGRAFVLSTATVSVLGWEREQPVIERWNEACG